MLIPLVPLLMPTLTSRHDVISSAYAEQKVYGSGDSSAVNCCAKGGPAVREGGSPGLSDRITTSIITTVSFPKTLLWKCN